MKEFKNIVFDFGGVLLDLDYNRTFQQMEALLGYPVSPDKVSPATTELLTQYEKGLITTGTLVDHLKSTSTLNPSENDIIRSWNAMLLGWQTFKFDLLERLRQKFRIYLLSNTNELHLDWVHLDLQENHGISDFETRFFDNVYYSHLIHLRKPDEEIYRFVAEDARLNPTETLFIDDMAVNVRSAENCGWHTWHHDPQDNLQEVIIKLLGPIF